MSLMEYEQISKTITMYNLLKMFGGYPSKWQNEDYGDCLRLLTVEGIIHRATKRAQDKAKARAKAKRGARRGGKLSRR